jgi:hypothetical protein
MPVRVLVALFGALLAFFGATLFAESSAFAAKLSHAAAPLCDERAASAYAAEPAPQPIDAGDITSTPDAPCKAYLATDVPNAESQDDLHRVPDASHDATTILPLAISVEPAIGSDPATPAVVDDRPSDEHRRTENPPPRPIPWRS